MMKAEQYVLDKAKQWLGEGFDLETRNQVAYLMEHDPKELTECFYQDLEFGTGGLRGIMGVGSNRMNKYTVAMATQGLANYVKMAFPANEKPKAAIAYDCRNNSSFFAQVTAEILSANGFTVYLFHELKPTPLLSFAVRHLQCQVGVVITASHNPKEYNGYKVYWNDGAQLVSPHDKNVIAEVQKLSDISQINFQANTEQIIYLNDEVERAYINQMKALSLSPELIRKYNDTRIVFTPIHGTTVTIVPRLLKAFGFENIINVPEQDVTSGDFPTVHSPNPEEAKALEMALQKARETDADLVMASDPDGDRVGIAVKDLKGEFVLLNGNQTAALVIYYLLYNWKQQGKITGNEYIVKTIVTSELLKDIAEDFGVECYDVLTGFKFIAEIIRQLEGKKQFIGGGEESYGYLIGDAVRDKDAVIACAFIAETLVWAREQGKTLYELLIDIYLRYDLYKESLVSITKKGMQGMEEINAMMEHYRHTPPEMINGSRMVLIKDYQLSQEKDLVKQVVNPIDLPKSNVLQFFLENGTKITMRPSGTEPKIKFYFGTKASLTSAADFEKAQAEIDQQLKATLDSLGL